MSGNVQRRVHAAVHDVRPAARHMVDHAEDRLFFSSRRRHTRYIDDWSSDVCSSDLPPEFYWPLVSLWWSFHGGLWVDHILIPLAGLVVGAAVAGTVLSRHNAGAPTSVAADSSVRWSAWGRKLLLDPVFGASVWAVAGYILFMTYQNHPQPRYFAEVAFFCIFVVAQGAEALLGLTAPAGENWMRRGPAHLLGWGVIGLAALAMSVNGAWTLNYAAHPEYTFVNAAQRLTQYIDARPNGKR